MGDYVYLSAQQYFDFGTAVAPANTDGGTIPDVDDDDTFEAGDAGPNTYSFETSTVFYGTIDVDGVTYPVFQGTNGFKDLLIVSQTLTPLPGSIDPSDINTSATFAMCFAAGTRIATPRGETPVETLAIGDLVTTVSGAQVPVKWIGRQTVFPAFHPAARCGLVRLAAGSLGDGLPHSDLTVTRDHALLVGGVLCNAGALINGTTIVAVPKSELGASYAVYHIETEDHEIILANGAPAETFIDNVSRRVFDNFAEYQALYGEEVEMTELPLPRATTARQLPAAIRARLAGRCAA